ncbi:MAG TPA: protein-methionine-sulfoxide reductase heme-binding subunit MsrQ [Anaeromyxobacteraceae bacterium]|nr:protein-methionine-sulfoxide reductase heme-binding subunit MsrQ [Anaeromyxobacteraceae bacterium]
MPAAVALGLVPLAKIGVDAVTGGLSAEPVQVVLSRLGFWALTFLVLSLAPTPLKALFGITWPMRVRRTVGLLAFGYGALHLAFYLGVDKFFDWPEIWKDVTTRRFQAVGLATLLLLLPLAVTSTDAWVRRLGFARWKRLHRLVYLAAVLGVTHFTWRVKADLRRPLLYAAAVAALLAVRLVLLARKRLADGGAARRGRPGSVVR